MLLFVIVSFTACLFTDFSYKTAAVPTGLAQYEPEKYPLQQGDLFVAEDGSDANEGTFAAPFASIEKARDTLREWKQNGQMPAGRSAVVCIKAGNYPVESIAWGPDDSGTEQFPIVYAAYGDGDAVLNAGISLKAADFKAIEGAEKKRLCAKAARNVRVVDLKAYGLTAEDWGALYAFDKFDMADKYDGESTGPLACELFIGGQRMTTARYPNQGTFAKIEKVLDNGDCIEDYRDGTTTNDTWKALRNPRGGTIALDKKTMRRIKKWQSYDDAWIMGFFYYDWAEGMSPLASVDLDKGAVSTQYASYYGFREGTPYYLYNVFEELDAAGEWYLDRKTGLLYVYPPKGFDQAQISLSVSTKEMLTIQADAIEFKGLQLQNTRAAAIVASGDHLKITQCTISQVAGEAIMLEGSNNIVSGNRIFNTGKSGIIVTGGERSSLTPGNNQVRNNLIHDWSQVYYTSQPGVVLHGAGNICAHNELYNAPHEAVFYTGNNHVIEYNVIHDVVRLSEDAGAIYSGRRWDWYGNVIRYNCIYNIGSKGYAPDAIYMDDALSGQEIYGNLLVNIPKNGIYIGGGRDMKVYNNLIINARVPIGYDQRARDGSLSFLEGKTDHWTYPHFAPHGDLWEHLQEVPYKGEVWRKAYPALQQLHYDFSRPDDPQFASNPANSSVHSNICINKEGSIRILDGPAQYSSIKENGVFRLLRDFYRLGFADIAAGDYRLNDGAAAYEQAPAFENLPIEQMGRISS